MIEPKVQAIRNGSIAPSAMPMPPPIGRQHQHLREIDANTRPPASAERLQGGDGLAPAVEMAFHRIADADAADQKRGQADNGEKLREAVDVALELRRGVLAVADVPAGFRELRSAPAR